METAVGFLGFALQPVGLCCLEVKQPSSSFAVSVT